jgi:hypothetical protein
VTAAPRSHISDNERDENRSAAESLIAGAALARLWLAWGHAYEISVGGSRWAAQRRDNGKVLEAATSWGLKEAIENDHAALPVPSAYWLETG